MTVTRLLECFEIWKVQDSVVESKMLMEYDTRRQDANLGYLRTQTYLYPLKLDSERQFRNHESGIGF